MSKEHSPAELSGASDGAQAETARQRATIAQRRLRPGSVPPLTAETQFNGALLAAARQSAGASLQMVAEITRINKHYLRALEADDVRLLPAPVYVRGFVHEYARVVGLAPAPVADGYMRNYRRALAEAP